MERTDLKNITDQHYLKMKEYACGYFNDLDRHTVHQFRVEYKKLRAFLRMLSGNDGKEKSIKIPKSLRRAYKITGRVRDLQLHMADSCKSPDERDFKPVAYLKTLRKKLQKCRAALVSTLAGNPIDKSRKKVNRVLPALFTREDYRRYADSKQYKIDAMLRSGKFNDQNLHTIRKILKDLVYNSDACASAFPAGPNGVAPITADKVIRDFLDELGDFQDQCSSLTLMNRRSLHALPKKDRSKMGAIKRRLLKERKRLRHAIIWKIRGIKKPVRYSRRNINVQGGTRNDPLPVSDQL